MIELSVDQSKVAGLAKALKAESKAAALRKDLIANIKVAVQPGVSAVQGKLRAIPSEGKTTASPRLSSYLASRVKVQVRLTGASAGVRVRIAQTPNLRGFRKAAQHLNRASWRHRVFGRDVWVTQESPIPDYFDSTLTARRAEYRAAVLAACRQFAWRLGRTL